MKTYLISYDLVGTSETAADYGRLIAHIKSYPNWAKIHKSFWAIKTNTTAVEIRDALERVTDPNDRLFVAEHRGDAAWQNVLCTNAWLTSNL